MKLSGKEDKMKADKPDRRMEKTRHSLLTALSDLMQEKKYNNITVQEIIDKANVGRSTFYAHFETKDELLSSCIETIFEMLNQHITGCVEQTENETRLIPVAELFEHVKENSRLIKGLMVMESSEIPLHRIQFYWNNKIEEHLYAQLSSSKELRIPLDILTNHITFTLIELLKWWVNCNMPYTPQQMDQYFHALINPCIHSAISTD
jgi:AcrR family transcriptional regulator